MKLSKKLKAEIKAFSMRFSFDEWSMLNSRCDFLDAIEAGNFTEVIEIADKIRQQQLS